MRQLYYQNYEYLSPVLTMVRLLPMFVTGVLCNVIVALVVGRVPVVFLISERPSSPSPSTDSPRPSLQRWAWR